jgi:hypothetical protein
MFTDFRSHSDFQVLVMQQGTVDRRHIRDESVYCDKAQFAVAIYATVVYIVVRLSDRVRRQGVPYSQEGLV